MEKIKNILKIKLIKLIGYDQFKNLVRLIRRKNHFSENDLIYDYLTMKHITEGTMIDVGVHFGESSYPFLLRGWKVFGFEPDPENRKMIPFRHRNFILSNSAVGAEQIKRATFYRSTESSGISSLTNFKDSHRKVAEVEITTLKKIIDENSIEAVDFLKIDTEGHDLMVLRGMDWSLDWRPKVILCEFEDYKTLPLGYNFEDLADYLLKRGYKVLVSEWEPIVKYGLSHSWKEIKQYPCKISSDKAWGNIIAYEDNDFWEFAKKYISQFANN